MGSIWPSMSCFVWVKSNQINHFTAWYFNLLDKCSIWSWGDTYESWLNFEGSNTHCVSPLIRFRKFIPLLPPHSLSYHTNSESPNPPQVSKQLTQNADGCRGGDKELLEVDVRGHKHNVIFDAFLLTSIRACSVVRRHCLFSYLRSLCYSLQIICW